MIRRAATECMSNMVMSPKVGHANIFEKENHQFCDNMDN